MANGQQNQFDIAGQQRLNVLGQLLGGIGQALAPNTWMGNLGAVGQQANAQLLQQQTEQKQTSQINEAGAQQQQQFLQMLGQLLGGGAPAAGAIAPAAAPAVAPAAAPAAAPTAAAGGAAESPFVKALLQALPQQRQQ